MIVFTDENGKLAFSIESSVEKTVSTVLKFSPKTRRFLRSHYENLTDLMENGADTVELNKLTSDPEELEKLDENDLQAIIATTRTINDRNQTKIDLIEELLGLLDLQEEYDNGVFTLREVNQIYDYAMNSKTEQNQNLTPQNIEKKTLVESQSDTSQS
jgi:hypothetical protein